jgi:hypothetical protein
MKTKLTNKFNRFIKTILFTGICVSLPSLSVSAENTYVPNYIGPFLYAGTASGSSTSAFGLQGIKGGDIEGQFLVTGTSGTNGVVYSGPINNAFTSDGSGSGTWYPINVPSAYGSSSTSIYGVDNLSTDDDNVDLVGSYVSTTLSNGQYPRIGFYYSGSLSTASANSPTGFQQYRAANPKNSHSASFTYIHSISNGLAVGNYDFLGNGNPFGHAFIYNPDPTGSEQTQTEVLYPDDPTGGALTHTAYGIWFNSGTSYTIAGGVGSVFNTPLGIPGDNIAYGDPIGKAYLIDYDSSKTGSAAFSNYQTYSFKPTGTEVKKWKNITVVTHFEGIWSNGSGTYKLPATVTAMDSVSSGAQVVTVKRNSNGSFSKNAKWEPLNVAGTSLSTNDSLYGGTSVGLALYPAVINSNNETVSAEFISDYAVTPILK